MPLTQGQQNSNDTMLYYRVKDANGGGFHFYDSKGNPVPGDKADWVLGEGEKYAKGDPNAQAYFQESDEAVMERLRTGSPLPPNESGGTRVAGELANTQISSIQNPAETPQTTGSGPTLPPAQGAQASATYTGSVSQNVENQKAALQAEADKRAADYQAQIDALNKKEQEYQAAEDLGMTQMGEAVKAETAEKRAALELEKQRFDENYNANQKLIGELDGLLTQGNQIIEQMKNTTGLASIMEPRIAKTMSDVAGRAGVIQAVLSARNGQMSYAQQQLNTSFNAISSIYGDQIDYYKTVVAYYDDLKGDNQAKINKLTSEQRDYLDVKLNLLENDLKNAQATYDYVKEAMLDPDTAQTFAQAGVSLTDSVATINQKLAAFSYSQEVSDISNKMASAGYSTKKVSGAEPVTILDSKGKPHMYYKAPDAESSNGFTLGANDVRFDAKGNVVASGSGVETSTISPLSGKTFMQSGTGAQLTAEQIKDGSFSKSTRFYDMKTGDEYTADDIKSSFKTTSAKSASSAGTTTTVAGLTSGKMFVSGQLQYSPEQYKADQQELLATRGSDGYVDPAVYLQGLDNWIAAGGLQSDYLQLYPIKDYVNPKAATNGYWPRIAELMGKTGSGRSV